ncbi:MAG: hypothetical protein GKR94_31725 [Gammaproteobacteria bacterium]|nr:hypothetical protein [Gammaproteobacteria bacterium]
MNESVIQALSAALEAALDNSATRRLSIDPVPRSSTSLARLAVESSSSSKILIGFSGQVLVA